ncbi:MAG: TetR/AcrR family transcriptional regulator [Chloroflexota bacterium]
MARKRESTLVRRRQIINAARRLIIRHGSEHVTVRRIAREIGTSEGAIYRHFRSKRDILSLLLEHIEEDLIGDIERGGTNGGATLETLDRTVRGHVSAIEQRKGISFQVIAEVVSLGDKKLNTKIHDALNRYVGRIEALLSRGVEAGEIRDDIDLNAAAILFFGMTQGLVNIWSLGGYRFNLEQGYAPLWSIFRDSVARNRC